jgi:hypothetical protein
MVSSSAAEPQEDKMSAAPEEGPERLKLENFKFDELRDPKLRAQILKSNKCGLMSRTIDDEAGTVEITLRDRRFADAHDFSIRHQTLVEKTRQFISDWWRLRALARS